MYIGRPDILVRLFLGVCLLYILKCVWMRKLNSPATAALSNYYPDKTYLYTVDETSLLKEPGDYAIIYSVLYHN